MTKFARSKRLKAWASCIVGVTALAAMAPAQSWPWYQMCNGCVRDAGDYICGTWVCSIYATCQWVHNGNMYMPYCGGL